MLKNKSLTFPFEFVTSNENILTPKLWNYIKSRFNLQIIPLNIMELYTTIINFNSELYILSHDDIICLYDGGFFRVQHIDIFNIQTGNFNNYLFGKFTKSIYDFIPKNQTKYKFYVIKFSEIIIDQIYSNSDDWLVIHMSNFIFGYDVIKLLLYINKKPWRPKRKYIFELSEYNHQKKFFPQYDNHQLIYFIISLPPEIREKMKPLLDDDIDLLIDSFK